MISDLLPASWSAFCICATVGTGMPVSAAPYKPSTGTLSVAAMSIGFFGDIAFGWPTKRPYQATPALTFGLCAAYIQTMRPPQQKPVMPSLSVLPFDFFAQATAASRSDITCASGTFATIGLIS